ncbi:uncharacterized protein [Antedon mediterranea]|uniref:uncharacterized protein isoform X2 n=1 Tax=Antedon mediterranea TaxID=105859 RepID=UPI003AF95973
MDEIDESDIHLCLKCNSHINGLENYIKHRKSQCKKQPTSLEDSKGDSNCGDNIKESTSEKLLLGIDENKNTDDVTECTGDVVREKSAGTIKRKILAIELKKCFKERKQTSDEPENVATDYDYSRYLEDKLLGNIDTPFRQRRTEKDISTKKESGFIKKDNDDVCEDDNSDGDWCETRKKRYRKKKSGKKVMKKKKKESCKINGNVKEKNCKGKQTKIAEQSESVDNDKQSTEKSDATETELKLKQPKSKFKTWTCPICKKVIRASSERVHMRIHSGDKPFKCHMCAYSCVTQSDMRIHMKRHLGIKDFKCSECDYAASKHSLLRKHVQRHRREKGLEELQYQCDECGKKYVSLDGLRLHIKSVHENNKPFVCTYDNCKYAAVSNSELEIHIRTHTKEKPFLCTQCGYKAGNKNRLRRHMITHSDETPFKCDFPECTFVGKTAYRVRRHKKQHDPVNRLCCPYCSYTTFYLGNLRKHIKNTAKHKDTKVYLCDVCKVFNTDVYKDLIEHYLEVHKEDVDVTVHSGGANLGQFNQSRKQDENVEGTILIIPEESIVIDKNVEFTT